MHGSENVREPGTAGGGWYLPAEESPLLLLSVLLLAGVTGGLAAKYLRVPTVTGNILAGVCIGPTFLNLFPNVEMAVALRPLSTFAMGLIAVSVGSQLSYRRLHNALGRIVSITTGETLVSVGLVTVCAHWIGLSWPAAFVLGCVSAATAPATTIAIVREARAKGPFVKTLLSVVALDNIVCIVLFAFASTLLADYYAAGERFPDFLWPVLHTAWQLGGSLALGTGLAAACDRLCRSAHAHQFSIFFVTLLLADGVSEALDLSPLLTGLIVGIYLGNGSPETERTTRNLEPIEPLLYVSFFTIAGASLHFDQLVDAGVLCAVYLVARFGGKILGATLGGRLATRSSRIWSNVGLGLVPQAGVAIGLVVLLEGDTAIPAEVSGLIGALVLGAVTVNEIVGPLFTRLALSRAGEVGKDRRRLIEFLQEEYIWVGLEAKDKWEALDKLVDFHARSHRLSPRQREYLRETVRSREEEMSTAIGHGAAIPHGRLASGERIEGVLAISREGIDFEAPDRESVQIVVLVATPPEHEAEHLQILAALARMNSDDRVRSRLIAALNANDAWEVIEGEETPDYNTYLDEEENA